MRPSQLLHYDYSVAKLFMFATILFGIIGMVVGVVIAFQMACPELNYIAGEYSAFGRLRPLHTNGIIFGFMLSGIFATWYYIGQRVLKVSMSESPFLMFIGKLHFWLYMLVMVWSHRYPPRKDTLHLSLVLHRYISWRCDAISI